MDNTTKLTTKVHTLNKGEYKEADRLMMVYRVDKTRGNAGAQHESVQALAHTLHIDLEEAYAILAATIRVVMDSKKYTITYDWPEAIDDADEDIVELDELLEIKGPTEGKD